MAVITGHLLNTSNRKLLKRHQELLKSRENEKLCQEVGQFNFFSMYSVSLFSFSVVSAFEALLLQLEDKHFKLNRFLAGITLFGVAQLLSPLMVQKVVSGLSYLDCRILGRSGVPCISRFFNLKCIQTYYNMNENDASHLVDRHADKYSSLEMALMTSINVLEQCWASEKIVPLPYSHRKMHRGPCVLKKQRWAPLSMLQCLWSLPSIEDANVVVDQFSEVGLVDVQFRKIGDNEVKGIQLHDLVHDVATRSAFKANEESAWHERLLRGYSSVDGKNVQMKEGCHEWWTVERGVDKYVDENVVRHLVGAEDVCGAVLLVTIPQWISRQVENCGILSFERDVDLVTELLRLFQTKSRIERIK